MKNYTLLFLFLILAIPTISVAAEYHTMQVDFTFTATDDPVRQLIGYRLYEEADQVCEISDPDVSNITCTFATEDGTFDFTLTAIYSDGSESPHSPSFPFTIVTSPTQTPLQAVITATPTSGEAPLNVSFSGTNSIGDIISYSWDFGDGEHGTGSVPGHIYSASGTYTVTLLVTDQSGATNQTTTSITVQSGATNQTTTSITVQPLIVDPNPPTAVVTASTPAGDAPLKVSFDGSASTTPNSNLVSYTWNFGDGTAETNGANASHIFTTAGTFTTQLTVVDNLGLSATVSIPIIVIGSAPANEKPVAVIASTVPSVSDPLTIFFDGSQSSDSDGSIVNYTWNFGDGTTGSGQTVQHTYASAATYAVSLQVTDDQGDTAISTTNIVCTPPLADTVNIEVGKVNVDDQWITVKFKKSFNHPIVIAGPPTYNGANPVAVRIRNINETGFEMRLEEWGYLDGHHADENLSYIVIEQGIYTLNDGSRIEAGSFIGTKSFQQIALQQLYDFDPVIQTQVVTENKVDAVTGRVRNGNQYSFEYKLQEMEATVNAHIPETINYIAWEPGKGEISGQSYEVGMTARAVTRKWFDLKFASEFSEPPFFVAGMQTYTGNDTATLRSQNISALSAQIQVDEEQSKDNETRHAKEVVGYIIIGSKAPLQ